MAHLGTLEPAAIPPAAAGLEPYRRAANYLAAAQIYLCDNFLLEDQLRAEHIKPRLLGHWGTCPGINLAYAGLNRLILERDASVLLVTGPGHGAAANLANLWLEGSLEEIDSALSRDRAGLARLVKSFSWPDGFPSHLGAMVPGTIHEGGELGYALGTAFGAALDNPDLLVACIVGDGEAETGPTAGAWHATKFLDPAGDGAVLPILHLNGYKIANPTLFGTMSDRELHSLFEGYGWWPLVVAGDDLDAKLARALERAHDEISALQAAARAGRRRERPQWPMIVLRSPKGWTGIDELDGVPIEGTWRAHQVPVKDARANSAHLARLEEWLRSYRPWELFDAEGRPAPEVLSLCPAGDRRMGRNPHADGGRLRASLHLPAVAPHAVTGPGRGEETASAVACAGQWLLELVRQNELARNFRIFSPDELESNRLGAVLEATSRVYSWPVAPQDRGIAPQGRVMEVLSEHLCQGWLQGYALTGRHGLFPTYEAFAPIVDGMLNQYAKFLKTAREVPWRAPVPALTYLLTAEGWRQEHNGYSHQGPGFLSNVLARKEALVRVYLPPDANTLLVTLERCLDALDEINVVVATKQTSPQWLTLAEARAHLDARASRWAWAGSDDDDDDVVDVVLACGGAIPTVETVAAARLLQRDAPSLRVRVVNVCDLHGLRVPELHPHGIAEDRFAELFTEDRPVVFAFHGYPSAIHHLLHRRPAPERFHVRGYVEEGTTTTPFDLLVMNDMSRYQLAIEALRRAGGADPAVVEAYELRLREHRRAIVERGEDPPELADWRCG